MQTYITVHAIAQNKEGKLLILQRAKERSDPGLWNCVTGYLQDRESAEAAALRELKEETNLTGRVLKTTEPFWVDYVDTRWVVISSLIEVADVSNIRIDAKESQNYKWIAIDDPIIASSDSLRISLEKLGLIVCIM